MGFFYACGKLVAVVSDIITGDNIPDNEPDLGIDLNNGGWILIAVLVALLLFFIATTIIYLCNYRILKTECAETAAKNITTVESMILTKYRRLNTEDKKVLEDTLESLVNKPTSHI